MDTRERGTSPEPVWGQGSGVEVPVEHLIHPGGSAVLPHPLPQACSTTTCRATLATWVHTPPALLPLCNFFFFLTLKYNKD